MREVRVDDLDLLEERFRHAFATGKGDGLSVVGYGEITSVVAWQGREGPVAAKRLPAFIDGTGVDEYIDLLEEYIARLRDVGLDVVPTTTQRLVLDNGDVALYLLQPLIDEGALAHNRLREASREEAVDMFERVFDGVEAAIGADIGIDAQVSNWALNGDELVYFDVTTPLLRDGAGADRLDTDIFLASLPWMLRGFVKRFMVRGIIDEYFDVRITILNLLANLYKERLNELIPLGLDRANARLGRALTAEEVRRYYAKDARMWELLQRLRRADRWWHLRIRRHPYPFLLPGKVER